MLPLSMLKYVIFQDYHFSGGYYEEGAWIHKRKTKINMLNIINTTDFVYEVRRRRIWNTEVEENNNGTSTKINLLSCKYTIQIGSSLPHLHMMLESMAISDSTLSWTSKICNTVSWSKMHEEKYNWIIDGPIS